ncbi:MAG TPA: ABC transporter substrate-binding protein [Cytophagales bacterium]|nr:ABC transporter substrate-binding protein [Cytophagales bacterium]
MTGNPQKYVVRLNCLELVQIKMRHLLVLIGTLLVFQLPAQTRIVTAGSSSSEIVCELGLCENIVATDRTSLFPAKLQTVPSIGYRTGIGAEGIISQNPDLIILESGYVKEEVIAQLSATSIHVLVVDEERTFDGTKTRIRQIATALAKEEEGEALIRRLSAELETLAAEIAETTDRPTVLCVMARGQGNVQVAGGRSAFTLVDIAGATNALPDMEGYRPINAESLIQANPDYILFFESGLQSIGGVDGALALPGVAQTTAGKERQILAIDGVKLTNWGPRLPEAARELFEKTHPSNQD